MDLGLKGKKAIVCAASKGLGRACAESLAREGVSVVICARTEATLMATAEDIRKAGGDVTPVVADVNTDAGRAAVLQALPDPDFMVNNSGGPPPGDFRDWDRDTWIAALDGAMLNAIELIKATVDGMIDRKWGRILNITSRTVYAPLLNLGLSNGTRLGLTGFCAGLARQIAKDGVTINGLCPGVFETDRVTVGLAKAAAAQGKDVEDFLGSARAANPTGRMGDPKEFGELCAFMASVHTGYITGQNILIDGGDISSSI